MNRNHSERLPAKSSVIAFCRTASRQPDFSPMHDPVEVRHLRYFLAVAEAGSFLAAPQQGLGISQPSVSQQMRDLEVALRVSLSAPGQTHPAYFHWIYLSGTCTSALTASWRIFLKNWGTNPGRCGAAASGRDSRPERPTGAAPARDVRSRRHPGISLIVEEISSTEIETALEEGRMDVGLGFLTRHSPNLRYERLCTDEFALIVPPNHAWSRRRSDQFLRTSSTAVSAIAGHFRHAPDDGAEISRKHQVRPRTVAEINSIETLLRSLGPLQSGALMPKVTLARPAKSKTASSPASGKKTWIGNWAVAVARLSDEHRRGRFHQLWLNEPSPEWSRSRSA